MTCQLRLAAVLVSLMTLAGCASAPAVPAATGPRFPNYPALDIPAGVQIDPKLRAQHELAWTRLQAGDVRSANRDFGTVIKRAPDFYPSATGLAFAALADRQYKTAATRFSAVLAKNDRYLPAWLGQAEAQLGLKNDGEALVAMERALALDPKRVELKGRIELVRFRRVQTLVETGRSARQSGKLPEAEQAFNSALTLQPQSTLVLRELALLEVKNGAFDKAEAHVRRAVELEPNEAEGQIALADVLAVRKKYREASAAYAKAAAIEPKPEWSEKAAALAEQADLAALPPEFSNLSAVSSVTRAHVAALVAVRLRRLIDAAPKRPAVVATDMRTHWASPFVMPVTRAGVMDVYPNHTFQPSGAVRRLDLAQVVSRLVTLAGARRPAELARWQAARPKFADLPASNLSYRAAALAVSSGALATDADDRFQPTRPATGAELDSAVTRLLQIAEQTAAAR